MLEERSQHVFENEKREKRTQEILIAECESCSLKQRGRSANVEGMTALLFFRSYSAELPPSLTSTASGNRRV
jgi:hypothetical protein